MMYFEPIIRRLFGDNCHLTDYVEDWESIISFKIRQATGGITIAFTEQMQAEMRASLGTSDITLTIMQDTDSGRHLVGEVAFVTIRYVKFPKRPG